MQLEEDTTGTQSQDVADFTNDVSRGPCVTRARRTVGTQEDAGGMLNISIYRSLAIGSRSLERGG